MKRAIFAAALALLAASPASAQGYDCRDADTVDEVIVCDRGGLARLDHQLNVLYGRALASSSRIQARRIRDDQRDWLDDRRSCGPRAACIRRQYLRRISQLRNELAD